MFKDLETRRASEQTRLNRGDDGKKKEKKIIVRGPLKGTPKNFLNVNGGK